MTKQLWGARYLQTKSAPSWEALRIVNRRVGIAYAKHLAYLPSAWGFVSPATNYGWEGETAGATIRKQ